MARLSAAIFERKFSIEQNLGLLLPGFSVAIVIGIAAQFLSDHYGAPAMLMALLLGIAFSFLAQEGRCVSGVNFTARTVLRFGVALLGARISVALLIDLGAPLISLTIAGVALTILFGLLAAQFLGQNWRFAILTGGSVAICGASAAMAIAAVLPKNEDSERNLIFTVLAVTTLSTIAMVCYPLVTKLVDFDSVATGVFFGGTIHDVAQVVGAGFSVNDETGETATLVKLIRVTTLAPVILCFSLFIRTYGAVGENRDARPPLIPGFVLAFLALATLNSIGFVPAMMAEFLSNLSRWALLVAIAAVGIKTELRSMLNVDGKAIVLIVAETIFLAIFILSGLHWLT